MHNEIIETDKEFRKAVSDIKVERGLSNLDLFEAKVVGAYGNITPTPHITFGNKKLPPTTAIYDTTAWFLCPGKLYGFCDLAEQCNMKFREVMGNVLQSRFNNQVWYRLNDAETVADFIVASIKVQNFKGRKVNLVRFNTVGDFRRQEDLNKIIEISNLIYENIGLNSYVYTHNRNLDFNGDRPHLIIIGSDFMVDNQYTVKSPEEYVGYVESNDVIECYQDCEKCGNICAVKSGIEVVGVLK